MNLNECIKLNVCKENNDEMSLLFIAMVYQFKEGQDYVMRYFTHNSNTL